VTISVSSSTGAIYPHHPGYRGDVDLTYLREHPGNVDRLIEHQRIRTTPVPGGDICRAERLTLEDGTDVFCKSLESAPNDFFRAEAEGLRWLAETRTVAIPEVVASTDGALLLEWIAPGPMTVGAAEVFGRELAALHNSGATGFGRHRDGFIGTLSLDNSPADSWAEFYAERRVRPYLRLARDRGVLSASDVVIIESSLDRLPATAEPAARLHGDLWSGNLHAGADGRVWLVDPAAHGGHRETDLAMLRLFGAPHLERILRSYAEASPLADGWEERVPLHQLHPLLVHAVLFGTPYGERAVNAARRL
jgi:fructosamine-3-kinase